MDKVESLILRLTERCNLRCRYCYAAGHPQPDMTPEILEQAIALCCQPGETLRVQFTGGEPLLAFDLMRRGEEFGRRTGRKLILAVQTNATLLTPEICQWLRESRCAVGVSLDGLDQCGALRCFPDGRPALPAALEGVRMLGQYGIRCNLTAVITSANAERLDSLLDLALGLGIAGIGLDLFRPLGRGAEQSFSPAPEQLERGLRAMLRRYREIQALGIPLRLRELDRLRLRSQAKEGQWLYCYAQTEKSLAVDGVGNCWPCSSLLGLPGALLGNLRDGLPQAQREIPGLMPPPKCQSCSELRACRGGCPAGRIGNQNQVDLLNCLMLKIFQEEMGEKL